MTGLIVITRNFLSKGHERTVTAKRNIVNSVIFKIGSVLIGIFTIPLTLNYISASQFGVWITLSSLITWLNFFDIGLGNGLKNKLAEAIAVDDLELGKIYVSTTYFTITLLSGILFLIFYFVSKEMRWSHILNTGESSIELGKMATFIFCIFAFQLVFQLINVVAFANQNTSLPGLVNFLSSLITLITIYILSKTTEGSLMYLALASGLSNPLLLLIFSIILYKKKYRIFCPSFAYVRLTHLKHILPLGLNFFIIQIGVLLFYNTNNLIIAQIENPAAVAAYNIAFKYFSIITMISAIVMTPFWPAFTEANIKKDFEWIKVAIKKLETFCFITSILSVLMVILSPFVYRVWVGTKVTVPFSLSLILALYTSINIFRTIFSYYLNGVGKIRLQLYTVLLSGIINILLAIFLGKRYGATGVISATTIVCILSGIIEIVQAKKLINNTAEGIWSK